MKQPLPVFGEGLTLSLSATVPEVIRWPRGKKEKNN